MAPDALEIAIRAEEAAKSAHHRLDRMNGSIERLADQVSATNGKIDSLVGGLVRSEGVEEGRENLRTLQRDSRKFTIGTVVSLFAAAVASFGALLAVVVAHYLR